MEPVKIILGQLRDMARGLLELLPNIAGAVFVLLVVWILVKLVRKGLHRALDKRQMRSSLRVLILKLVSILIWSAGVVIALMIVVPSITPGKLFTALGLSSIAIGFAFKDIFENFIAGMLILFRAPFELGDYIECEGIEGKVEDISIRDTRIRQTDGQPVIIPNAVLFTNPVTVRTSMDLRRTTVMCGVGYGEDVDKSREVIRKAVEALDSVNDKKKPVQIFAREFGASSIDFEITWWTGSTPLEIRESRDEVIAAVKRALDEAGIEIPFPYRTLTFPEKLRIESSTASA